MRKTNLEIRSRIFRLYGSQLDFAQQVGMDCALVSKILCNRRPLPKGRVDLWCEFLKCTRAFLEDLVKIGPEKTRGENANANQL